MPTPGYEGADIPIMLNNAPHEREVRKWFYDDCADSIVGTVTGAEPKMRVKAKIEFPELNVDGDVYRVGTLLELVREIAMKLAADGKKVRVCVQGSMGTGVFQALPLSLNGIMRILELMDWVREAGCCQGGGGGSAGDESLSSSSQEHFRQKIKSDALLLFTHKHDDYRVLIGVCVAVSLSRFSLCTGRRGGFHKPGIHRRRRAAG